MTDEISKEMTIEEEIRKLIEESIVEAAEKHNLDYDDSGEDGTNVRIIGEIIAKRCLADRQRLEDKWAGMTENKHIKELRRELAESKHKLKQMTDNAFTGSASCKICFEKHKKEIERLKDDKALFKSGTGDCAWFERTTETRPDGGGRNQSFR